MPKETEGEILGPGHAYDDPNLSPQDFLLAIMHDTRLPVSVRMDAAAKVSVYIHPRLAQVQQDVSTGLLIRIEGGLPALPGTDIIMPQGEEAPRKTNGSGQP